LIEKNEFLIKLREGQDNFDLFLTNYIKEYLILFGTTDFKILLNDIFNNMNIKNMKIMKN